MPKVVNFKAFCLERYKYEHDMNGRDAMALFKEYGVFDYISSFYDVLHSFGDKYIVQDIELFIKARASER
ncbi:MAG: DUF3791 domain-containing protein [Defluviitaleaceae bacterium]|nr:DUF3791 domain-containing protein [Defluviitaleaceae bacterium]